MTKEKPNKSVKEITRTLTLAHRLAIEQVMPKEFDGLTYKLKTSILDKTIITDEEFKEWNISFSDKGGLLIPKEAFKIEKPITFTDLEFALITSNLKKLEMEKKLSDTTGPLWVLLCT